VVRYSKYTKELTERLEAVTNIVIFCHVNPDGDAIGSQLALYYYLLSKGKNVSMISPNNLQDFLTWMNGVDKINVYIRDRKHCNELISAADLHIMVDFNQMSRLGEAENAVRMSKVPSVIIDHHLNPGEFGDMIVSDSTRCSTSELIYLLLNETEGKPFSGKEFSEAVYVGIITDTGNFEHGSFTGETFRIIADLLDSGIEREYIYNKVFNNFSEDRLRLKGLSLNCRMTLLPDYGTAYIVLSADDLSKYNYKKGDTEGFVNMPLSIKGVTFTALFIEKKDHIKLSFRSKGGFSVNDFASKYFNGGGHKNASGGDFYGSLEESVAFFLQVLEKESANLRQ
jgi:phosphoesterase RecJ-like protein